MRRADAVKKERGTVLGPPARIGSRISVTKERMELVPARRSGGTATGTGSCTVSSTGTRLLVSATGGAVAGARGRAPRCRVAHGGAHGITGAKAWAASRVATITPTYAVLETRIIMATAKGAAITPISGIGVSAAAMTITIFSTGV